MLASCTQKDSTSPVLFSFTVNGAPLSGSGYNATYDSLVYQFSSSLFIGDTTNHNYMVVEWSGNRYVDTGTYRIDSLYSHATFNLTYVNGKNLYFGSSGSVRLTQ